jgi:energy-coupling factor transport system permease protein
MSRTFQLYTHGASFLYTADPRVKILGVLVAFYLSVLFTDPLYLGTLFAGIVIVDLLGGIPPSRVIQLVRGLLVLASISVLMWPLLNRSGDVAFRVFDVPITRWGLSFGFAMGFRILSMVLASTTLMTCTHQSDLVLGLRGLGLPYKACFAFATGFRFLPTMIGIARTIVEAQEARGLDLRKGGVIARLKHYAAVLAPMIIESIRVAQQLALSVEVRGFGARKDRTTLRQLTLSRWDWLALQAMAIGVVVATAVRILGYGVIQL